MNEEAKKLYEEMCRIAQDTNTKLDYLKWILNGYVNLQQEWITSPTTFSKLEVIETPLGKQEVSVEELKILFSIINSMHEGIEQLTRKTNQDQFDNGLSTTLHTKSINIQEDKNTLGR